MQSYMIIMRGLPGSGKSSLAGAIYQAYRKAFPHRIVGTFSADSFYYGLDGKYYYDSKLAGYAHMFNQGKCAYFMRRGYHLAIVDNTNITIDEMKPYLTLASLLNWPVFMLEPETPWAWDVDECVVRNTHGVPRDVIQSMMDRYQPLDINIKQNSDDILAIMLAN